jgi:hypothetical protein
VMCDTHERCESKFTGKILVWWNPDRFIFTPQIGW